MAWVAGRTAEYEAESARALGVNPTRGDTYRTVAAHAARKYRFDEAVALGRRAVALEPTNMPAYADLGMNLLRLGAEAEARRMLDTAFRGDPYDLVTLNLLRVLDTLDGFETQKSGVATIRMDPDEAPVLGLYAGPLVARALAEMRGRYGIDPRGAVTIQIFPKHDDFAVRTAGLPGMEGALGASFGSVVTQDSPRARKPGDVQLAGDDVARAGPRVHAAALEPARAAVGHRGHLDVRGGAGRPVVAARRGAGVRQGVRRGTRAEARESQLGIRAGGPDLPGLLRVVARRCRSSWSGTARRRFA